MNRKKKGICFCLEVHMIAADNQFCGQIRNPIRMMLAHHVPALLEIFKHRRVDCAFDQCSKFCENNLDCQYYKCKFRFGNTSRGTCVLLALLFNGKHGFVSGT